MYQGKFVFAQLLGLLNKYEFKKCVDRYQGNYRVRTFTCWQQFICLLFGQLAYRDSLRDIVTCLNAIPSRLYHLGVGSKLSLSTFADANERRDWRIYADFCRVLIAEARLLYRGAEGISNDIGHLVYSIDSSTIGLCLSIFPWAKFKSARAGIKLHTQLDLAGSIPAFMRVTPAKLHDVNFLDMIKIEPGAFYVMDKAYADLKRLFQIHSSMAFFVVRPRRNMQFRRIYSSPKTKDSGVKFDQTVVLTVFRSRKAYPEKLRLIKYYDRESGNTFHFLTNNTQLPAEKIAELYKNRWQVELFFKWIKQHLKIKRLWGYSENAVKTQIWTAITAYLLVAIAKKRLGIDQSLYKILQILSLTVFDKAPLNQLFTESEYKVTEKASPKQLSIFDL